MTNVRLHSFSSLLASSLLTLLLVLPATVFGSGDPFPVYDCLKDNVAFWEDVYSRYSLDQGIIHDSENLAVVYEVISLVDDDVPSARKINERRSNNVKHKYRNILNRLAAGKEPANAEEERVRQLFGDRPGRAVLKAAVENIRMQRGQKDRFREGVIRSGAYLERVKEEFRNQGLPEDLAYLAHVESSFNVKAYSKFGAAGIWQFTRSTGRRFMQVDYTIDERRDPFRATSAAALYLKENYQRLGDWPLALTAYNHGANGMARAKDEMGGYPEIFRKYESRIFGFASRNFYSEFLAARHVAKNYRRYFGEIELDRPQRFFEFEMKGYSSVRDLASHFQVDIETIAEMNPALRMPIFNDQKYVPPGYVLRLPARGDRMAALGMIVPDSLYRSKQKPSRFYEVRRGDTAGIIARRHRVSLSELILANQLNRQATVYVGQNLRIPVKGEKVQPVVSVVKAEAKPAPAPPRILTAQNKTRVAVSVPPAVAKPEAKPPAKIVLPEVAAVEPETEAAPEETVSAETDVASDDSHALVNRAVVYGHLKVEKVTGSGKRCRGVIRVEVGETLGHYAEWLDIRAQDLRRMNGLRYGKTLRLNQKLKIPLAKVDRDQFEERRFEYHKEIEEDFFAAYRIEEMRKYRIKKGDNIWLLSNNKFEVPFWLIKKYNANTDFGGLRPNQQLLVPVVERIEERLSSPGSAPLPSG